jgi:lipopolysaccharide transport system permease protein
MNRNEIDSIALWAPFLCFWRNRNLILELAKRDVVGRYRGSIFGLAWSFFNPLVMLSVYTFVFSIVFQAKWQINTGGSNVDFALMIFAGMIIHSLFAECINKSPTIIIGNVNFVKKVIFPIDILAWVSMGSAIFHFAISLLILVFAHLIFDGLFSWKAFLLPIVIMPLILMTMGISWFLSSLGVYLRDIGQLTSVITTILMFLSPIFFPASAIPEKYSYLIALNPLTTFIEETRNILLFSNMPNWEAIAKSYVISAVVMYLGYVWFQKTRRGFADVL